MNVILFRFVSTFCFAAILLISYALHDPTQYQYRDDGVITMSVGRNLIDFGFLGVSPSGPRVEASSSPLQTFVYAGAYALTGLNYSTYSWLQTSVATFIVGWILSLFFGPAIKSFAVLMRHPLSATNPSHHCSSQREWLAVCCGSFFWFAISCRPKRAAKGHLSAFRIGFLRPIYAPLRRSSGGHG